jgi:hypothetical protein
MHNIESLRFLVEEFTAKSNRVLEYSKHQLATGLQRERIVESFVKKITPKTLDVGSGFISDGDSSSPQVDIIIHNDSHFSPLFSEGGYLILLPDSVVQTIEVKSYLDSNSLTTALDNCYQTVDFNKNINSSIFGFDGIKDIGKVFDIIEDFANEHQYEPDVLEKLPKTIVNLNNWVIILTKDEEEVDYNYAQNESFEEQFLFYFFTLYYTSYSYIRKIVDGNLPLLQEQGFQIGFHRKDIKYLRLSKKNT